MISFSAANGNLFPILGKLGAFVKAVRAAQTSINSANSASVNGAIAQLAAQPDIQALLGTSFYSLLGGIESPCSLAQQVAQQVINRFVYLDNPQQGQGLTSVNVLASINEVIRQMKLQNASVLAMTIASANSSFTGRGNGAINVSTKRPSDGKVLENTFPETLNFVCSADSFTGGQTAFNEQFTVTGQGSQPDVFAYNWPLGSSSSIAVNAINGDADNSQGNILTNSGFASWTSNVPNNWTLVAGTAGTNIVQENGLVYSGPSACKIIGDASNTPTQIQQAVAVSPLTQYSACSFMRTGGSAPSQGLWTYDLCDSVGNTIQDANGVNNTYSIICSSLNTVYTPYLGAFRTPAILPSTVYFRARLSSPLNNGGVIYTAKNSIGLMTRQYVGGPNVAVHSGNVAYLFRDFASAILTNSFGAGSTLSTYQILFNQFFQMQQNNLLLPSSNSPSIADSLIG